MLKLEDDNGKPLPKKVSKAVNDFIDNLENISWFQPDPKLKKSDVDKQIKIVLKCFRVKAGIEYRELKTVGDWSAARSATWGDAWSGARDDARGGVWGDAWGGVWGDAWGGAMDDARDAARGAAWGAAWGGARDAAWGAAEDAAWDAAMVVNEILLSDNKQFKKEYPDGTFKQIFKLWEMGLYPVGVLKNKKFVVYSTKKLK